jgi:hypothetical protein
VTNELHVRASGLGLASIVFGRLSESALESANEAGVMSVSDGMSDLFDRKVTNGEKLRGFLQPSFG